jgi:hypothetical protein
MNKSHAGTGTSAEDRLAYEVTRQLRDKLHRGVWLQIGYSAVASSGSNRCE